MTTKKLTPAQIEAQFFGNYRPDFVILAPEDRGDECTFCHKLAATIEDGDTGDRYCDMDCYDNHLKQPGATKYWYALVRPFV